MSPSTDREVIRIFCPHCNKTVDIEVRKEIRVLSSGNGKGGLRNASGPDGKAAEVTPIAGSEPAPEMPEGYKFDRADAYEEECPKCGEMITRGQPKHICLLKPKSPEDLLEKLAAIEHDQWIEWSKNIAETEMISPSRLARWKKMWIPYNQLSEDIKELDRRWARKVLTLKSGEE